MRTKAVIAGIAATCAAATIAAAVAVVVAFRLAGVAALAASAVVLLVSYTRLIRPWHARWGASADELQAWMPGDGIVLGGSSTTRAITIEARPEDVWPWLVQIGFGRAGWYSYDWIDNDGTPSERRVVTELQSLQPGDTIEMLPGFGPIVREVVPNSHFVAGDTDAGTWCLAVRRGPDGTTRLVSRWRQDWHPKGLGERFFVMLSDPGAFVMERKMLRGIKKRAESAPPSSRRPKMPAAA